MKCAIFFLSSLFALANGAQEQMYVLQAKKAASPLPQRETNVLEYLRMHTAGIQHVTSNENKNKSISNLEIRQQTRTEREIPMQMRECFGALNVPNLVTSRVDLPDHLKSEDASLCPEVCVETNFKFRTISDCEISSVHGCETDPITGLAIGDCDCARSARCRNSPDARGVEYCGGCYVDSSTGTCKNAFIPGEFMWGSGSHEFFQPRCFFYLP